MIRFKAKANLLMSNTEKDPRYNMMFSDSVMETILNDFKVNETMTTIRVLYLSNEKPDGDNTITKIGYNPTDTIFREKGHTVGWVESIFIEDGFLKCVMCTTKGLYDRVAFRRAPNNLLALTLGFIIHNGLNDTNIRNVFILTSKSAMAIDYNFDCYFTIEHEIGD